MDLNANQASASTQNCCLLANCKLSGYQQQENKVKFNTLPSNRLKF